MPDFFQILPEEFKATLSSGGRIDETVVREEIDRMQRSKKQDAGDSQLARILGEDYREKFDEFDLCQLEKVISVCCQSKSRAEAGKKLFAVSRLQRKSANDSDRLGKYLEKFGLTFAQCRDL